MYISVPELYPTRYNAPVLAACYAAAVAGTSVASYLPNAIGGTSTLFLIFVCCLGCVPVAMKCLPETLNKPYPEGTTLPLPPWFAKKNGAEELLTAADASDDTPATVM